MGYYTTFLKVVLSSLGFHGCDEAADGYPIPLVAYKRSKYAGKKTAIPVKLRMGKRNIYEKGTGIGNLINSRLSYADTEFNFISDIFPGEDVVSKMKDVQQDSGFVDHK